MTLHFDPIAEAKTNWEKRGWQGSDSMVVATSIVRAHQLLTARITASLSTLGLSFARFEVLALLDFSTKGQLPMGKIGARLQVHPTSVTSLVKRLASEALVEVKPHPTDGRTKLVSITQAGVEKAEKAAQLLSDVQFGIEGIPPESSAELVGILTDMRQAAGDWGN